MTHLFEPQVLRLRLARLLAPNSAQDDNIFFELQVLPLRSLAWRERTTLGMTTFFWFAGWGRVS